MSDQLTKEASTQSAEATNLPNTVPENTPIVNDYDIDAFLEKRKEFIEKVNAIMVQGADYHVIQGKKSLAKGGAEKIASIFGWTARFEKDNDVAEAFGKIDGLISFVCNLEKLSVLVGQGRGAAILSKNSNDPNKTVKMAQKSSFIDAVLRASGLSDFFTQDLEDMPVQDFRTQPTRVPHAPLVAKNGNADGGKIEISEGARLLIEDLKACNSPDSYKKISKEITMAHENGKLNAKEFHEIAQEAKKTVKRIESPKTEQPKDDKPWEQK